MRSAGDGSHAAAPLPELADDIGFDAPGHHRARENVGEKEKLEASSMDASRETATARWRAICGGAMARARKLGGEARKWPYSARFSTGTAQGGRGG